MKRRRVIGGIGAATAVGTVAAVVCAAAPAAAGAAPAQPGERVDWPAVRLLDGSVFGPEQADDRAMVVVFWSTTCPFCRRHNQRLEALWRATSAQRLGILGVATDRDAAAVRRHAEQHGYTFPITVDRAPLAAALTDRNLVPLTVTVGRDGRLRQVIPGEMSADDLQDLSKLAKAPARETR